MLYDITPPITDRLAVWPGDTPPTREVLLDLRRGDSVTLSTLRGTVHLGAHADGPNHYGVDAPGIGEGDLAPYLGPCRVVRVPAGPGGVVGPDDIALDAIEEGRLLIATGTYPDPTVFREDFAALDPALIGRWADRGGRLVGVDTPSVDRFSSKDLPAHRACLRRGVAILEGLVLDGVPEGRYELIAPPLKLIGWDASPVRALLRTIDR